MGTLSIDRYPRTQDFFRAANEQIERGAKVIQAVADSQIVGTVFSKDATRELLALRIARDWVQDPSLFKTLIDRLDETPKEWE